MPGDDRSSPKTIHSASDRHTGLPDSNNSSSTGQLGFGRASVDPTNAPYPGHTQALNRRTSFAERIGSLGNAGGPNSFNNFAASWQRAAGFHEIPTGQPSSYVSQRLSSTERSEAADVVPNLEQGGGPSSRASLLRSAVERDRRLSENPFDEDLDAPESALGPRHTSDPRLPSHDAILIDDPPPGHSHVGSYGSNYGSFSSRPSVSFPREPGHLSAVARRQSLARSAADKEQQPLIRSRSASITSAHSASVQPLGQSTLPQTVFNSVNVLIGVGMLSLPMGIRYSGWLIGLVFFLWSTVATQYTAKLLAKCLDLDYSLVTFADIAYGAFGHRARVVVSLLFTLELIAACVAMVILFADSINLLIPSFSNQDWKLVCGVILLPLSFLPLRFLSFTSILGILCCVLIVIAVFVDGLVKPHALGSLREPAETYLTPKNWGTLPLAFGLLMAPWGGHSVFPNIYRDMRHPRKYNTAVHITYAISYFVEVALAIAGYLMFGEYLRDEITSNIYRTEGYPRWLSMIIIIAITIVPLTKIPLNSRPIITTIEILCRVDANATNGFKSPSVRRVIQFTIRVVTPAILVLLAILIPSFERVMSLLGSLACFSICIILPCAFHLKIFGKELSVKQRILDWTLLVSCSILAILGTVCAFLPKEMLGAA